MKTIKEKIIPDEVFIKTGLEIMRENGDFKLGREMIERAIFMGLQQKKKDVLKLIDEKFDEAIEEAENQNLELTGKKKEIGDAIIVLLKMMKEELKSKIEGK